MRPCGSRSSSSTPSPLVASPAIRPPWWCWTGFSMTLCCRPWPRRTTSPRPRSSCRPRAVPAALVHADGGGAIVRARDAGGGRRCRRAAGARPRQRRVRHRQRAADGRREGTAYRMELPARTVRAVPPPPALSAALGVTPTEIAIDGNNYLALLPGADAVRSLQPDLAAIARLDRTGVVVTAPGTARTTSSAVTSHRPRGSPRIPSPGGRTAPSRRSGRHAQARTRSSPTRRRRAAASWPAGSSATGCSCRRVRVLPRGPIEL